MRVLRRQAAAALALAVLLAVPFAASADEGELTFERAQRLLAEASTVDDPAVFQVLARLEASPEAILRESASLPYVALSRLRTAGRSSVTIDDDLRFEPGADWAALARSLAGGAAVPDLRQAKEPLVLIRTASIQTLLLREHEPDWVTGEVAFAIPAVLTGHIRFVAQRRAGTWSIVGYELPVSHLRVAKEADGRWRVSAPGAKNPITVHPAKHRPQWHGPAPGDPPPPPPEPAAPPDSVAPAPDAVATALAWLAAHQSADGGWSSEGFAGWCDGVRRKDAPADSADRGKPAYDVGVTGLALLAFLGAGYTNRSEGAFGKTVSIGLRSLRGVQDDDGCFGARTSGHFIYNHAIAALAMVEAFGMTGSTNYQKPAQQALDFIAKCRNPESGWRYGVRPGESDTSVTGWMTMALVSAKWINEGDARAGHPPSFRIDEAAFDGVRKWLDEATDPDTGRVGYLRRGDGPARPAEKLARFPAERSEAMTAVAVFARLLLDANPKTSLPVKKGVERMASLPPTWNPRDGSIDFVYWYFGTLAMHRVGGEPWKAWEAAMKRAIVDAQRKDGDFCGVKGSWDPVDPWGPDGGRVYSTALMAMACEVWYRYDKVFGTQTSH